MHVEGCGEGVFSERILTPEVTHLETNSVSQADSKDFKEQPLVYTIWKSLFLYLKETNVFMMSKQELPQAVSGDRLSGVMVIGQI